VWFDITEAFRRIRDSTDIPPINLWDLGHVAASLVYVTPGGIYAVKTVLWHSTIKPACGTCTSLLVELDQKRA
jgi:hypothetical protein